MAQDAEPEHHAGKWIASVEHGADVRLQRPRHGETGPGEAVGTGRDADRRFDVGGDRMLPVAGGAPPRRRPRRRATGDRVVPHDREVVAEGDVE
jgi:hypothetical protein